MIWHVLWALCIVCFWVAIGTLFGVSSKDLQNRILRPTGYQWYWTWTKYPNKVYPEFLLHRNNKQVDITWRLMKIKDYELAKLREAL